VRLCRRSRLLARSLSWIACRNDVGVLVRVIRGNRWSGHALRYPNTLATIRPPASAAPHAARQMWMAQHTLPVPEGAY
jgi:hypothetical protein